MSKDRAYVIFSTTGAGIAIGSGAIQVTSVIRGSDLAGTLNLLDDGTNILTMSADRSLHLGVAGRLGGPVTMTSSPNST